MSAAIALKLSCHRLRATLEPLLIDLDRTAAVSVSVLRDEAHHPLVGGQIGLQDGQHAVA